MSVRPTLRPHHPASSGSNLENSLFADGVRAADEERLRAASEEVGGQIDAEVDDVALRRKTVPRIQISRVQKQTVQPNKTKLLRPIASSFFP